MKKILTYCSILFAVLLLNGCITRNPDTSAGQPKYIPDTNAISSVLSALNSAVDATAPVNPYAVLIKLGLAAGGALVLGGSIAYGKIKSNKADASAGALDAMSLGVVNAGPEVVKKVQEVAAATPHYAVVANAINENTP